MSDSPILLAITAEDDLVHVGTADALVTHLHVEEPDDAADEVRIPTFEFYDEDGARYRPVLDPVTHRTTGFEPDPDAEPPTAAGNTRIVDRLGVFQARVQVVLDGKLLDPDYEAPFTRAPQVTGELKEVVTALYALAPAAPAPEEPHPGSPLHNLWHAVFG